MLKVNSTTISMVHTNKTGNNCVDVDVVKAGKRVRVFTCLITLTLNQQSRPFVLRSWIDQQLKAKGLLGQAKNIRVINNLYQPEIKSGTLTGMTVELVNKGTIAGYGNSGTALFLQGPMKVTNHGWIRGSGGKGGTGSRGGTSGTHKWNTVVVTHKWRAINWNSGNYGKGSGPNNLNLGQGWKVTGRPGYLMITGPCGHAKHGWGTFTICGVKVSGTHLWHNKTFGSGHETYHVSIPGGQLTKTVPHHAGGHIGGNGGVGGDGIWWKHNAVAGPAYGKPGGPLKGGANPGGFHGGIGGRGGTGGTWGRAGARGGQGGRAEGPLVGQWHGLIGRLGAVGGRGGYCIVGKNYLVKGSSIGTEGHGLSGHVV